MEVITYKKQTSKTKYIIEAALEYRPPLKISHNFFSKKKKESRGFYSRKYGNLKVFSLCCDKNWQHQMSSCYQARCRVCIIKGYNKVFYSDLHMFPCNLLVYRICIHPNQRI